MGYKSRRRRKINRLRKLKLYGGIVAVVMALFGGMYLWKEQSDNNNWNIVGSSHKLNAITFEQVTIPEYNGEPYVELNGNIPFFKDEDLTTESFERYSELDSYGRCGVAYANVCKELMPLEGETRGAIGNVKPTGWKQAKYEGIVDSSPPYLYNRCHLIAWCLASENDNEKNLITGTRYMNVNGMLPFEEKVAKYIGKNSNRHVLYRVTPVFERDNRLAEGVLIEAYSVEDRGNGICFCIFCYNVQPGVEIDYSSGESSVK